MDGHFRIQPLKAGTREMVKGGPLLKNVKFILSQFAPPEQPWGDRDQLYAVRVNPRLITSPHHPLGRYQISLMEALEFFLDRQNTLEKINLQGPFGFSSTALKPWNLPYISVDLAIFRVLGGEVHLANKSARATFPVCCMCGR